jgi:TRAP-type C4-dicarboxylate transport system permease small subunit
MIYLDWQLLIGGALIVVVLLIELLDWATKPKKRKGRAATRPKQKP